MSNFETPPFKNPSKVALLYSTSTAKHSLPHIAWYSRSPFYTLISFSMRKHFTARGKRKKKASILSGLTKTIHLNQRR